VGVSTAYHHCSLHGTHHRAPTTVHGSRCNLAKCARPPVHAPKHCRAGKRGAHAPAEPAARAKRGRGLAASAQLVMPPQMASLADVRRGQLASSMELMRAAEEAAAAGPGGTPPGVEERALEYFGVPGMVHPGVEGSVDPRREVVPNTQL